jgi:hypothetical protein
MHPISYTKGIQEIGNIIKKTKIIPDIINVGGAFPSIYPDLQPQSLENYINEIIAWKMEIKIRIANYVVMIVIPRTVECSSVINIVCCMRSTRQIETPISACETPPKYTLIFETNNSRMPMGGEEY